MKPVDNQPPRDDMYKFLAENSIDAIWRLDTQLRFTYMSPAVKDILGYDADEMIGRQLLSILTEESIATVSRGYAGRKDLQTSGQRWESTTYTVEVLHKDGHPVWAEVTVNPIFAADNRLIGYNGITRDISERRRSEEALRQRAFRDPLTGLPNRWSLEEVLGGLIAQNKIVAKPFAVMFLDVDGLKEVNDAHGHDAGDELLKTVASRLCSGLRKEDFVARLAGDEFMAILPGVGDSRTADAVATRLLASLRQPFALGPDNVSVGVSIGLSFFPGDGDDGRTLIKHADQAMYSAKKNGGNRYACYGQISSR